MSDAIKTISLDDMGEFQVGMDGAPDDFGMQLSTHFPTSQPQAISGTFGLRIAADDVGQSDATALSGATGFSAMSRRFSLSGEKSKKILVLLLLLVLGGGIAFIFLSDDPEGLWKSLLDAVGMGESSDVVPQETQASTGNLSQTSDAPVQGQVREPTEEDLKNPYWNMPNPLEIGPNLAARGVMSLNQEENWRFGLKTPEGLRFGVYSQLRTVEEIRAARVQGAEVLLHEALSLPKFWARMEALFALAELGEEVDVDTVQAAMGDTRVFLIQNYFKRFSKQANAAEVYIQRQVLRVVDAKTREVILQNLAQYRDETNELYLYAASFDPFPGIVALSRSVGVLRPYSAKTKEDFKRYVTEEKPEKTTEESSGGTDEPTESKEEATELPVEDLSKGPEVQEVYFLNEESNVDKEASPTLEPPKENDGFDTLKAGTPEANQ